jgi:Tripartite tricarboxylate transporter TctB family
VALRIRSKEDFWSGLMFIGFGAVAALVGRTYNVGTAMDMGPGYFPTYLGAILVVIGTLIAVRSFWVVGEGVGRFAFRPVLFLSGAFAAFGLLMESGGLVLALLALLGLSAAAGERFHPWQFVLLAVVIVGGSAALFVYGLGLPFRLLPWE